MSDVPLHRLYFHYSELPYSTRVTYTAALCIIGLGYLFAFVYLFHVYAGKDGNPLTLSYQDIVIAYSGSGKGSRMESALRGPMSAMLPSEEATTLINWIQEGAGRPTYDQDIRPLIDKRCMTCHDGSNPHLPNFDGYDNIKKTTEQDTGTDIFTLVRVSHIHMFGLSFVFFIVGLIFSHAYVRPVWFKCTVIVLPFLCLMIDVGSWYMVKIYHPFAWLTMASGAGMGMSFAFMWVISMHQMWFGKTPTPVQLRASGDLPPVD
jgi:hypothetical protein